MTMYINFSHAQFQPVLNLNEINGNNGFVINGTNEDDKFGTSVSYAGDINADGIDDFIIGSPFAESNGMAFSGKSYVIFGNNLGYPNPFELSNINGKNGIIINGTGVDEASGLSVSNAGDFNNDGIDDLIIGAGFGDSYSGRFYIIFGNTSQFPTPFDLSSINGLNGIVISGANDFDQLGADAPVSSVGDTNNDGIDDIIIGAGYASPNNIFGAGSSYVVFGSNTKLPNPLELSSLNGNNGIIINGVNNGDVSGKSVSNAGDINSDGIDDFIIAAPATDTNGVSGSGSTYLIYGSDLGFTSPMELSSINGSNGIVINGANRFDFSSNSISNAGDFNGDGFDDLIIGAELADPNDVNASGSCYVIFGSDSGLSSPLNLSSINGSNGIVINGANRFDHLGSSVSNAGDVNGDNIDDIIIGASSAAPNDINQAGSVFVIFGSKSLFSSPINISSINGRNGFVINGVNADDNIGRSVSTAGDINGDGINDLIIGVASADPNDNSNSGSSFIIFGNDGVFSNDFEQ